MSASLFSKVRHSKIKAVEELLLAKGNKETRASGEEVLRTNRDPNRRLGTCEPIWQKQPRPPRDETAVRRRDSLRAQVNETHGGLVPAHGSDTENTTAVED